MLKLSPVFRKNAAALKDDFRYIINQGGTSCFAPETLINTANGYKPISQVQIGDFVLSYNEKYKKFDYEKVKNVFRYKNHKETYKVKLNNGNSFIATSDHKFFVEGGCISLKSMIKLKEKGEIQNARGMETDTEFQQIRGVKFGENKVNKLQEFWQSKNIETCTCERRIFKNNVIKRLWKILQLDCSQIYNINIFKRKTTKIRNKSQRRKQIKQCNRQFGICNKIREFITRIQTQLNNSETWLSQWQFKTNRGTSKRNKTNCSKWWQILWKKATCWKIWCFGMLHKRNCKSPKEYVARCLSIDNILSYEIYNQSVVYDIEVENNHNYCIYAGKDILVHNSTKTFSILQLLVTLSLKYKVKIDIVGLSVPHLKTGVLNDMPDVCNQFGIDFYKHYKSSDKIFQAGKGIITFLSFDKLGSAHGGRRDFLYLNEANHQHYNIVEQLLIRTRKNIFIDYNPTNEFWVHDKIFKDEPQKATLIKSTYKDNPFLEQTIIDSIEARKGDNNFWRVYGLGELGIAEGLVFENFEVADFDKNRFSKYRYGIDWGFSSGPFAFVECAIEQNRLYICNEIYQTKLLNKESSELVKQYVKNERIICDSAEPKSVQEYQSYGLNAVAAKKGKGSVLSGLKYMQQFDKIIIHPSCTNAIAEFKNYQYKRDKNGNYVKGEPVDAFNHCLVGNTLVATSKGNVPIKDVKIGDFVLTRKGYKRVLWAGISARNVNTYTLITKNGLKLTGTFNHKIYTNTGFRDIIALRYGDELLTIKGYKKWLKEKRLNSMAKFGIGTPKRKEVATEITFKNAENFYITTFGKNTMEFVKRATTSIIKMVILPIIILKILKKLQQKNTSGLSTPLVNSDCNFKKNILTISESSQKNGTLQQKDTNGIRNTLKNVILDILRMGKKNVKFVARCLKLKQSIRNFVQTSANQNTEDCVNSTKLQKTVNGAGQNLEQINTVKPVFVPDNVKIIQCGKIENQVYDLTIEDCHEFFANGILVHNCIDAIRYSLEDEMNFNTTKVIGMRPF